jgi:hypothetical protein
MAAASIAAALYTLAVPRDISAEDRNLLAAQLRKLVSSPSHDEYISRSSNDQQSEYKAQGSCLLLHGYYIRTDYFDVLDRSVAGDLDLNECFTLVVVEQISDRAFDVGLKNIDCTVDCDILNLSQRIIHDAGGSIGAGGPIGACDHNFGREGLVSRWRRRRLAWSMLARPPCRSTSQLPFAAPH